MDINKYEAMTVETKGMAPTEGPSKLGKFSNNDMNSIGRSGGGGTEMGLRSSRFYNNKRNNKMIKSVDRLVTSLENNRYSEVKSGVVTDRGRGWGQESL